MLVNEIGQRFERGVGKDIVFADFRRSDTCLLITHVEASRHLRGIGESAQLMREIAEYARQTGHKITPVCSYAAIWFHRHPAYADVLA